MGSRKRRANVLHLLVFLRPLNDLVHLLQVPLEPETFIEPPCLAPFHRAIKDYLRFRVRLGYVALQRREIIEDFRAIGTRICFRVVVDLADVPFEALVLPEFLSADVAPVLLRFLVHLVDVPTECARGT